MNPSCMQAPRKQRGVVLVVGLLLLMVMTILGVSSLSTIGLEERMSANAYDRSIAFQAAEAALREGEQVALTQSQNGNNGFVNGGIYSPTPGQCGNSPCQNGLCSQPDPNCTVRWLDSGFTSWSPTQTLMLGSLAGTAEYFVEYLGTGYPCNPSDTTTNLNCKRYRITARSRRVDGNGNPIGAEVMLQSIYATP